VLSRLVDHRGGQELGGVKIAHGKPLKPRLVSARKALKLCAPDVPELDVDTVGAALAEEEDRHWISLASRRRKGKTNRSAADSLVPAGIPHYMSRSRWTSPHIDATCHSAPPRDSERLRGDGTRIALGAGMSEPKEDGLLAVNCGRCGKPLKMPLQDLLHRHTVACEECEKRLPARVTDTLTAGRLTVVAGGRQMQLLPSRRFD